MYLESPVLPEREVDKRVIPISVTIMVTIRNLYGTLSTN